MASATSTLRHPKGEIQPKPGTGPGPFVAGLLDSSVGSKILVALTGLGLVGFVVFHMIGNLKMFSGPDAINSYAYFLKHGLGALIWVARIGLLGIFVLHLSLAVRLQLRSKAARPVPYQYPNSVQASAASRTMLWTGIVILAFTLFHLAHFTFAWTHTVETATGPVNYLKLEDSQHRHDVYSMVVAGFSDPVLVTLYVVAQVLLFVHLTHGIPSTFQTLGLKNRKFKKAIDALGLLISLTVLVGNLAIVFGVWFGFIPAGVR
jgi:succinate dehydrogenase / fumarate reductase cytochrome b subunit